MQNLKLKPKRPYVCKKGGRCPINVKTRKSCQRCRFDRCLAVGMKPSWVLTEEEKAKRFRKNREKRKQQASSSQKGPDSSDRVAGEAVNLYRTGGDTSSAAVFSSPSEKSIVKLANPEYRSSPLPSTSSSSFHAPQQQQQQQQQQQHPVPGPSTAQQSVSSSCCHPLMRLEEDYEGEEEVDDLLRSENLSSSHRHVRAEDKDAEEARELLVTPAVMEEEGASFSYLYCSPPPPANMRRKVQSSSSSSLSSSSSRSSAFFVDPLLMEPIVEISEDEISQIQLVVSRHESAYRSVPFGEELIKEMVMCSAFAVPMSTSGAITAYRLMIRRVAAMADSLEAFSALSQPARAAVLKRNADLMVSLRGAFFFEEKKKGLEQVLPLTYAGFRN